MRGVNYEARHGSDFVDNDTRTYNNNHITTVMHIKVTDIVIALTEAYTGS